MKHFKNRIIIVAGLLLVFGSNALAQLSNSLYFMDRIPQSNQLNPAIQPLCNFYFGIPGTNLEVNGGNSAVGFSDVLIYDSELDSLVWPIHNEQTKKDFLNKLKETSFIFTDNRVDVLSFGFRIKKTYLSFNVTERVEAYGFIPKDLFKLGLNFNQSSASLSNESFDLSNLGFKAQWYHEFGIGISQEINPNLNFGIRAKFLMGLANVSTSNSNIHLQNTGAYEWQTQSVIDINSSIPGMQVYNTNGKVDSIKNHSEDFSDSIEFMLNTRNTGFALDLGIVAKPIKNFTISASIVDLGYIRWKNNVNNFSQDGAFNYQGIKLDLSDTADMGQALLDTLESVYEVKANTDAYTTSLSGKLYVGVHYQILKGMGVGALTRLQLVKKSVRPQFTLSLNLDPFKGLSLTGSYTIADGVYDNFGLGMAWKLGPLQWYLISDRIPLYRSNNTGKDISIPFIPTYMQSVNVRTGINLVFGCRRKAKLEKSNQPLVDI